MMEEQLDVIFERVRRWPRERQREAAEMLALIEEQDGSPLELTDEQLAEVRRRRADADSKLLTLEEFDASLSRFGL
jgi:hypothetical protein